MNMALKWFELFGHPISADHKLL